MEPLNLVMVRALGILAYGEGLEIQLSSIDTMRLEVETETFQGLYRGKQNLFWLLEQGYEKQSSLCLDFGKRLNISSEISEY